MADLKNIQLYVAARLYIPGLQNYCLVLDIDPRTLDIPTRVNEHLVYDLTQDIPEVLARHVFFQGSLTQCREFAHYNSEIPYIDLIRKS